MIWSRLYVEWGYVGRIWSRLYVEWGYVGRIWGGDM